MKYPLLAAALLATAPSAADAATFMTRAGFEAAAGVVVTNDLNGLPTGPVTTIFGLETISSGSNPAGGFVGPYGSFGQALSGLELDNSRNTFDSLVISFNAPVHAFAFDILDLQGNGVAPLEHANIRVTFAGGAISAFTLSETDNDFSTVSFFGITSPTALQSIEIWSSTDAGGPIGNRPNLIDNLSVAVPEPATWAMLILGFGLAGAAMRRRTAKPLTA